MADKYIVARAADIPEGGHIVVTVGRRSIGVFRLGGKYYGLLNRCPHEGAELCRGRMVSHLESDKPGEYRFDSSRKLLACPWHGWEFDVVTGRSFFDPQRTRVRTYPVTVEQGEAIRQQVDHGVLGMADSVADPPTKLVEGPYRAETIPITVENDYLVVTMRPSHSRSEEGPSQ